MGWLCSSRSPDEVREGFGAELSMPRFEGKTCFGEVGVYVQPVL